MTAEVVGIDGAFQFTPGEPRPAVVATLKEWLEKAETGELVGVAIAAVYLDGSHGRSLAGKVDSGLVGELFRLMQKAS